MGTVYVVANRKGGVGKTTTATNVAANLIDRGKKVLLIDTDPQCNSSDNFHAITDDEDVKTLYDVILTPKGKVPLSAAIQHTDIGDIVGGDESLALADSILSGKSGAALLLKKALVEIKDEYEYIIVDTSPDIGILLINALNAADEVIIPTEASRFALQGLDKLSESIADCRENDNPDIKVAGFLLVMLESRTRMAKEGIVAMQQAAEQMGVKLFNTTIRKSVDIKESQAARLPITKYAPHSKVGLDYDYFVTELTEPEEFEKHLKNTAGRKKK